MYLVERDYQVEDFDNFNRETDETFNRACISSPRPTMAAPDRDVVMIAVDNSDMAEQAFTCNYTWNLSYLT